MDIFDPANRGVGPGQADMKQKCPFLNAIFMYMLWVLITNPAAGNTGALTPNGGSAEDDDKGY